MDFLTREATPDDAAAIVEIFLEVATIHADALPHVFRAPADPGPIAEFIAGLLADPQTRLFVAAQAGQVVGYVRITVRVASPLAILTPRRYAVVEDLAVRQEWRGQGIGRALLAQAEQWAQAQQVGAIELNVWEFNAGAWALYERLGYATFSRKMGKALD